MIRVNLLHQLDRKTAPALSKKQLWIFLAVLGVVLGGVGIVLAVILKPGKVETPTIQARVVESNIPQSKIPPQKQSQQPRAVVFDAVEEIVNEIPLEKGKPAGSGGYFGLSPSQKIQYQLSLCRKTLAYLKMVSSRDIGFTELTLSVPGDLYLQGKASNESLYREFKKNLNKAAFASIKTGMLKPFGVESVGREFSFHGKLKFSLPSENFNRIADEKEAPKILKHIKYLGKNSGMAFSPFILKAESRERGLKKRVYKIQSPSCTFAQFQAFISRLYVAKSKLGFEKVSLRADGDEKLMANLEAALYIR